MKLVFFCATIVLAGALRAQTPLPSNPQLDALTKKVDEINTKLDALSQQMLKLEQQSGRPGTMIGEPTPAATPVAVATAAPVSASVPVAPGVQTHVVAKGETLTAIAKQYKVSVEDLQKFNRIEDGRKLQAGQNVMIPAASPGPAVTTPPAP